MTLQFFTLGALFIVSVSLSGAIYTIYKLLKWRSKYNEKMVSFPEPLYDDIYNINKSMKGVASKVNTDFTIYAAAVDKNNTLLDDLSHKVTNQFSDILKSFNPILMQLDLKDQEIDRLKRGYDMHILKSYAIRLLKIHNDCAVICNDDQVLGETAKEINFIADAIEEILNDMGVKEYELEKGTKTKDKNQFGIPPWNEWVTSITQSKEDAFTVVQTLEKGYYLDSDIKDVLKYPKIEVLITEENNG